LSKAAFQPHAFDSEQELRPTGENFMYNPYFRIKFEEYRGGMPQKEIAQKLKCEKVTETKISRWVTGIHNWPPQCLKETCEILELTEEQTKELFVLAGLGLTKGQIIREGQPIGSNTPTEAEYQAALKTYLNWLIGVTETVVFHGIKRGGDQVLSLKLDDIYIPLAAEVRPKNIDRFEHSEKKLISMEELLTLDRRLVVTGAPGCGKTTILYHIAYTLARTLTDQPTWATKRFSLTGAAPIPILIPLSRYHDYRQRHQDKVEHQKLSTFIGEYLQQIEDLPDDFFSMLRSRQQPLILLLDGLDEVANEHERIVIAQVVERLAVEWQDYRIVVTCRIQAYKGRTVFQPNRFTHVEAWPLTEELVNDLVEKLYRAFSPPDCEERIKNLKQGIIGLEARRAEQLRDNDEEKRLVTTPLMVRLLLIVHFSGNTLPDRRAELYYQIVKTFLIADYNPDVKEVKSEGWEDRLEYLSYLAFLMHSQKSQTDNIAVYSQEPEAGREIAETVLRQELQNYIKRELYKSAEEAKTITDKFVLEARQRGGLFEQKAGLYRFSHLSFQEFLTARYLVENVKDVTEFILEQNRANNSWWREPVLLAVGYLSIERKNKTVKLIRRLADLDKPLAGNGLALALTELAATAFLEWDDTQQIRLELAQRLADLLTDPAITDAPATLRADAGRTLARLGDPREGVTTLPPALTDWLGGEFLYGENKERRVIKNPFKAGLYPITNAQYQLFVQAGGYGQTAYWQEVKDKGYWQKGQFKRLYDDAWRNGADDYGSPYNLDNHPVVGVSWYEAVAFCEWLTEWLRGQAPAYLSQELAEEQRQFWQDLADEKLWARLPTEAEWERLARHTDGREYPWGNEWQAGLANTAESGINSTCAVGLFPGGKNQETEVYDCAGNIWEWCVHSYSQKTSVVRGGSWLISQEIARCAFRDRSNPNNRDNNNGFRIVVSPISPTSAL
jgi:formylglycine-generating enzyme required for sulfatase activity